MLESMLYYSFDIGILELLVLSSIDDTNQLVTYTGQLKYISTATGKTAFGIDSSTLFKTALAK